MQACALISLGICLIGGGIFLTWWNEANLVCGRGAYEKASGATKPLETCSIKNSTSDHLLNEFVHISCPVDNSLVVSEKSTGISVAGAYRLTLKTEQYGFERTSETEKTGNQICDDDGENCKDETRKCSCLRKTWTVNPITKGGLYRITFCKKCPRTVYSSKVPNADSLWGELPVSKLGSVEKFASRVPIGDGTLQIDSTDIPMIKYQKTIVAPTTPTTIDSINYFERVAPELCNESGNHLMCYKSITKRANIASSNEASTDINVNMIGDLRLIVKAYGSSTISALGKLSSNFDGTASIKVEQFGSSRFPPCENRDVFYASDGMKTSSDIYQEMHNELNTKTLILRAVSFVMIFGAFCFIFSPIGEEVAECIPCIGDILGAVVGVALYIFSAFLAFFIWLSVLATAWVFYRPLFGIICFAVGGVFCLAAFFFGKWQVVKRRRRNGDIENGTPYPLQEEEEAIHNGEYYSNDVVVVKAELVQNNDNSC